MTRDKHHKMSLPSKIVHFILIKHEISTVIHHDVSFEINKYHLTDLLHTAGLMESPAGKCSDAIYSRIQLELKVQASCHVFHFDL
jgi:hypothetical protein